MTKVFTLKTAAEFDETCKTGLFGARAITVHDGVFHCDDVCAVALYATALGYNPYVHRDRKHVVGQAVDVGGGDYDHHDDAYRLDSRGVPVCGFSLVWETLKSEFNLFEAGQAWFQRVVVDPVSRQDNGMEQEPGTVNLFSFVHTFNPTYEEQMDLSADSLRRLQNTRFMEAVEAVKPIIKRYLKAAQAQDAIAKRLEYFAKNDQPVVVVEQGIPWVKVLPATPAKFVVYFDGLETYYVQCVPNSAEDPFSKKQALPEAWAGKRDEEFSKLCGADDGIFCHIARFICGFKSFNSATRIASELASGKFDN